MQLCHNVAGKFALNDLSYQVVLLVIDVLWFLSIYLCCLCWLCCICCFCCFQHGSGVLWYCCYKNLAWKNTYLLHARYSILYSTLWGGIFALNDSCVYSGSFYHSTYILLRMSTLTVHEEPTHHIILWIGGLFNILFLHIGMFQLCFRYFSRDPPNCSYWTTKCRKIVVWR